MELYAVIKANRTGVVVEEGNGLLKRNDNIRVFDLDNIQSELLLTKDRKSLTIIEYRKVIFSVPKKYRESIYILAVDKKYEYIHEAVNISHKTDMSLIIGLDDFTREFLTANNSKTY